MIDDHSQVKLLSLILILFESGYAEVVEVVYELLGCSPSQDTSHKLWFDMGFGDIGAQAITHSTALSQRPNEDDDNEFKINWKRMAATSLFGFGFVGPIGHYWYEGLDRYIRLRLMLKPNSFRFVATKVAVDEFIFGPLDLAVFFTYMGFANGKSFPQIREDVEIFCQPLFWKEAYGRLFKLQILDLYR